MTGPSRREPGEDANHGCSQRRGFMERNDSHIRIDPDSSKSVITLGHRGTGANQKWVCNYNNGHHTFNIADAPSFDGTDVVKIYPDSNFELLIRSGSGRIRNIKECSGQLIDCHFQDWHGTPESFAFSPDSKAFIASLPQSVWLGEIELVDGGSDSRCDSPIHCIHWDIRSRLVEEIDHIANIDYSPDGRYIAVVSYLGRILVFEQGKGFTQPLLVHDGLLNRDLGKSSFPFKRVTCANWSQAELMLTGRAFGAVPVPIGDAIRRKGRQYRLPTVPLNCYE